MGGWGAEEGAPRQAGRSSPSVECWCWPCSRPRKQGPPLPVSASLGLHTSASWVLFGLTYSLGLQGKRVGMYANE